MLKSSYKIHIYSTEEKEYNFYFHSFGSIIIKINCREKCYPCSLFCCKKIYKKYNFKTFHLLLENKKYNTLKKMYIISNIERKAFSNLQYGKYNLYLIDMCKIKYICTVNINNPSKIIEITIDN